MVELGKLEARHRDFAARQARVVAASVDGREDTAKTQADFPHLVIVSDADHKLAEAAAVLGPHHSYTGEEVAAPTTFLIDRRGIVRWVFRPDRYIERLTPEELLARLGKS